MPGKTLVRLGLGFLVLAAAVYLYTGYWLRTRIFVPLDVPVTLGTPQIKSPPFQINLRESYYPYLAVDSSPDDWRLDAPCNATRFLDSEWRVYRLGRNGQPCQLWAECKKSEPPQVCWYRGFNATSGRYQLEWDMPAGAGCLDSRHPRMKVVADSSDDYASGVAFLRICCIFLGGTGAALVFLACARALKRFLTPTQSPRMFPGMTLRNVIPMKRHAPLPLIHWMPQWALFCGAIFLILTIVHELLKQPPTSRGLSMSWPRNEPAAWQSSPWPDTLEVYVGPPSRFYINGQEVERSELRSKLKEQLGRRAEWSVYFEADLDEPFFDAAYAMDAIEAVGGKLIWVTPNMRKEWERKNVLANPRYHPPASSHLSTSRAR